MCPAGLLHLPPEVVEEHVLPQLSCRGLGALLLTCKQLRACVAGAELTSRLADAGRVLSRAHPLFSAPCIQSHLEHQAGLAAATATPSTWQTAWSGHPSRHASFSPDLHHAAAASSRHLHLYSWDSNQPLTRLLLPPICFPQLSAHSWHSCWWSPDSRSVGWLGRPYDLGQGYHCCPVFLYRLVTGELQSTVLRSWPLHGHEPLPKPRLLASGSLVVFTRLQHSAAALHILSLGASKLQAAVCPVTSSALQQDERSLAVSSQDCIAFVEQYSQLCLWQPGSAPVLVPLHNIVSLTWSPCSKLLLVDELHLVTFVDSQGQVLSSQQASRSVVRSPRFVPVWAPQGVLMASNSGGLCSIEFFAVVPGPYLRLQHRHQTSGTTWLHSPISASHDHFAVVLSRNQRPENRQLCVFRTPRAVPAGAGGVQITQAAQGLVWSSSSATMQVDSSIIWRADGSALLCRTPDHDRLVRFC